MQIVHHIPIVPPFSGQAVGSSEVGGRRARELARPLIPWVCGREMLLTGGIYLLGAPIELSIGAVKGLGCE